MLRASQKVVDRSVLICTVHEKRSMKYLRVGASVLSACGEGVRGKKRGKCRLPFHAVDPFFSMVVRLCCALAKGCLFSSISFTPPTHHPLQRLFPSRRCTTCCWRFCGCVRRGLNGFIVRQRHLQKFMSS